MKKEESLTFVKKTKHRNRELEAPEPRRKKWRDYSANVLAMVKDQDNFESNPEFLECLGNVVCRAVHGLDSADASADASGDASGDEADADWG